MSTIVEHFRGGPAGTDPAMDVDTFALAAASPPAPPAESWQPWMVRVATGEFDRFQALCGEQGLTLLDTIHRQLVDLAAIRLPGADDAERQRFIEDTLAAHGGAASYGNWIYLPWETKVVHLLDRDAYFEVVTNRNHDKITREEQQLLRTRRVGVMGLSVGAEAAVAVAQEHLCGEIVLADFDHLDLSNLNRLGAGFDEVGEHKAVITARRIAKVDPYLRVSVLLEGVMEKNLDLFLDGLDLLIEECDGLRIKHEVRRHARKRGLNVVFAGDERGFLSVEPYGHRSELLSFHGRIEAPPPPREAFPTELNFLEALTEWLGGWDEISERSQRSLEQVGKTLCGYPQLASEARYAAGQLGHVARRLLLGERLPPYLGNLDLEELLPPPAGDDAPTAPDKHYLLFYDVVDDYVARRAPLRAAHLEHAWQASERGELLLAGATADPVDGAVLLFRGTSPEVAAAFARADPYVTHGLVAEWRVREWTTVVGEGCSTPVSADSVWLGNTR